MREGESEKIEQGISNTTSDLEKSHQKSNYFRALEENGRLKGEEWLVGWIKIGGEIDEETANFFKEREVVASEAIGFFANHGKFKKPDEDRWKDLKRKGENEKASIEIIQRLPLNVRDRVELLLCYLGEKSATTFIIEQPTHLHPDVEAEFTRLLHNRETEIKRWLEELNLVYKIVNNWQEITTKGEIKLFQLIHISKDKETLERLVQAWNKGDDRQIGLLYGYPKTAVDAWVMGAQKFGRRPPLSESWDNPFILKRSEIPHYFPEEQRVEIEKIV